MTAIYDERKTYYVLTDECELSVGGWCLTHSTGDGPIYCAPLPDTTHTPADPGADECAADAAGEWERDLSEYGVEL